MVVPVLYGGYLVATIAGRVAISVIARYAAKHGIKKAVTRFGSKILKNNKVKSAINNLIKKSKTLTKTVVKGGKKFKVKYKAKTPKGKAILKKIVKKAKGKPVKVAKGKPVKTVKGKPVKVAKGKPTKTAKGKPTKTAKGKPIKTAKGKPTKLKPTKTTKLKPTKVVKGGKTFWTKGKIIGGAITAGTLAGMFLSGKGRLGKGRIIIKGQEKKKPEKIIPRPKPDAPRDRPGPQSGPQVKTKLKDIPGSSQYGVIRTGPQVKKKFTEEREKSFEARVRALVAQKDRLKNVEAGDGRSEYQVRMHKLKKENKKAWKKLFTIGGKLK